MTLHPDRSTPRSPSTSAASTGRPGPAGGLPSLTGLRFIAAGLVFLFHSGQLSNPVPPTEYPVSPFADASVASAYATVFSKGGFVGVSFFFVLSGFVLTWSAKPGDPPAAFIRRRLVKIFPNHVVTWALMMVLVSAATTPWTTWLPNLFAVHAFFPDLSTNVSVNTPSWSLSSELLFYLSFPLLVRAIAPVRGRGLVALAAGLVLGLVAFEVLTSTVIPSVPSSGLAPVPDLHFWFGYLFPVGRLFEFTLGIVLARMVRDGLWPRAVGIVPAVALFVASYALAFAVPAQFAFNAVTMLPIGVLIATFAQADLDGRRTGMRNRTMVWLGNVSFGFYLFQGVGVFYVRSVMEGRQFATPVAVLLLLGMLAVTVTGGWLLYRFVETPSMRRWSRRRTPRIDAVRTDSG